MRRLLALLLAVSLAAGTIPAAGAAAAPIDPGATLGESGIVENTPEISLFRARAAAGPEFIRVPVKNNDPARIAGFTVTALPEGGSEADMLSASGPPGVSGYTFSYKLYFADPPQRDTSFTISVTPIAKESRMGFERPKTKTSAYIYKAIESLTIKTGGTAVENKTLYLQTGGERQTVQLTADKNPTSHSYAAEVRWQSSDPAIASVDPVTGVVTGNSGGTVTITASVYDDPDTVSASCTVTVIPIKGIGLNPASKTLFTGGTPAEIGFDLTATLSGDNGSTELVWKNSSPNQVTMTKVSNNTYHLSAFGKQPGSATITVTDKGGFYKAACTVTVVQIQSVSVLPGALTLYTSGSPRSGTLSATVNPSAWAPAWAAGDESLVSVSGSGKSCTVTANTSKGGSTTVTASVGGKSASCAVKVIHISGIRFTQTPAAIYLGGSPTTTQATAVLESGEGEITYSSSNESVAQVDAKTGKVTAVSKGNYTITATAPNGLTATTANCTVGQKVTNVRLTGLSLEKGASGTPALEVLPQDADNRAVAWSITSGNELATIDASSGKVTAKTGSSGAVTVTATARDGSGKSASCTVTVEGCEHSVAAGGYAGGAGTAAKPWKVSTPAQLDHVRQHTTAIYQQTANLNLSGYSNWTPIGQPFTGEYDGKGLSISNLKTSVSTPAGLFGSSTGVIKNLTISSGSVTGAHAGGIVGVLHAPGRIDNCHVNIAVTGVNDNTAIGGIVGYATGRSDVLSISNCTSAGSVNGPQSYAGGIVGHVMQIKIGQCTSRATVYGGFSMGGIVGACSGHDTTELIDIYQCYWTNPDWLVGTGPGTGVNTGRGCEKIT